MFQHLDLLRLDVQVPDNLSDQNIYDFVCVNFPNQRGLVFCLKNETCDNLANFFNRMGLTAAAFHSNVQKKTVIYQDWNSDKVFAFSAFDFHLLFFNILDNLIVYLFFRSKFCLYLHLI